MDDLDTERFIDEVKKRKAIWDSSLEEHKNRNPKKRQWIEVCTLFYPVQTVQINHMGVLFCWSPSSQKREDVAKS
jgi:hypothetical protein